MQAKSLDSSEEPQSSWNKHRKKGPGKEGVPRKRKKPMYQDLGELKTWVWRRSINRWGREHKKDQCLDFHFFKMLLFCIFKSIYYNDKNNTEWITEVLFLNAFKDESLRALYNSWLPLWTGWVWDSAAKICLPKVLSMGHHSAFNNSTTASAGHNMWKLLLCNYSAPFSLQVPTTCALSTHSSLLLLHLEYPLSCSSLGVAKSHPGLPCLLLVVLPKYSFR